MNFPPKLSQRISLLEKFIYYGGVNVLDPDSVWISPDITIGRGTVIYPNSYLIGETDSRIGEDCEIGPSTFIRDRFQIGNKVKIGFNAEVVRSSIGDGTKIPHFCHIGDATIGRYCNIAAGVEIGNYDGNQKHQTIIEDYAFIGIGVKIIAPVIIRTHAYIGAGAIVSKNVKPYNLIIGVNKVVEGKNSYCKYQEYRQDKPAWHIYPTIEHPVWNAKEEY